ncbi:MAG: energy transducer TonB, partial [Magnetospirillum sp. WYHS-4]
PAPPAGEPPPEPVAEEPVVPAPPPPIPRPPKPRKTESPAARSAQIQVEASGPPAGMATVDQAPAPAPAPGPPAEASLTLPDVRAAYLSNPRPAYPLAARRRGQEGVVVLSVRVGEDGAVREIAVARGSGIGSLDTAALEAVRVWRFKPAHRGGRTVEALVEVPIRFSLAGTGEG